MQPKSKKKTFEMWDKWGDDIASRGFAQIPNYLLFLNQFVDEESKFSPVELLLLIQIVGIWWQKNDMPFPSIRVLSIRCGTSERQVLRALKKLEELNLLKRSKRRQSGFIASNAYDLSPLVDRLNEVSKAFPNAFPRSIKINKDTKLTIEDELE